jgi:nucleoside-triphosphatase THEP1
MPGPVAVILSGARGSGKTSVCRELADSSPSYAGIVCPSIVDADGGILGKLALCLDTSESWELARTDADLGGPRTGRFSFSAAGIDRAVACLRAALNRASRICIIDEIGPLELDRGEGFAPILPLLESAGPLIVAVRTGLAPRLAGLLPRHEITSVSLDDTNRGEAVRLIRDVLFRY